MNPFMKIKKSIGFEDVPPLAIRNVLIHMEETRYSSLEDYLNDHIFLCDCDVVEYYNEFQEFNETFLKMMPLWSIIEEGIQELGLDIAHLMRMFISAKNREDSYLYIFIRN